MAEVIKNIVKEINRKRLEEEILVSYTDYEGLHSKVLTEHTEYKFFFEDPIDDAQLDLIISQHDASVTSKEAIIAIYKQRERHGYEFFSSVRADLALSYMGGEITQVDAAYIESKLDSTKSKVLSGDWLTAQYEITNNVTVEGALTQETYDLIKGYIGQYIIDNYT